MTQPTADADCESARRTQHLAALAAVPSRGRTPLGATSTPRCAHMPKVERWDGAWAKLRRASPSYTRRRSFAATNLVAPGPMWSHRGHRPAMRASRPYGGTVTRYAPGPALRRDGAAHRERRVWRRDRDAADNVQRYAPVADVATHSPYPSDHPSPVRAALGCCVQRNRQKKPPLPASHLLAHSADGAPGAAPVQVEHHLHRPCALRLGYIVPPTRPPAS